ncbi:MAG: hypothetical protein VX899_16420 [Myxococcota bacterium]|nr:hypothetical protein [Myxococcota bacterium]
MSTPLEHTRAQHLRRALLPLGILGFGHGVLGLCGLNVKWFPESVALLMALLPVSSLLLVWAGRWAEPGSPKHGRQLWRVTLPWVFAAVGASFISGDGVPSASFAICVMGVASGSLAMCGYAVADAVGRGWLPLAVLYFVTAALGLLGAVVLPVDPHLRERLFFAALNVPVALFVLAAAFMLRRRPGERALLETARPEGAELLGDALPLRVRYRVPCQVPYGLRVTSLEEGVPLGNPILDHLLGLSTVSPAESARLLSDSEDTVLGLLHRFPDSHLEADAVVFEATAAQLAEAGDTQRALEEGVASAEALAALLKQADGE